MKQGTPSESRRGLIRIFFNYARLGATLSIGLAFVPFVLYWIGKEAFGLIAFVSSTVELVNMMAFVLQQSLIRELSVVFRDDDAAAFRQVYNSSLIVSMLSAIPVALVYCVLIAVFPVLNIRPDFVPAARWMLGAQGLYAIVFVISSPIFTSFVVKEEFGWSNLWRTFVRVTVLAAALILCFGVGVRDAPQAIKLYGILWSALLISVVVAATVVAWIRDPRLLPSLSHANSRVVKRIISTFGWNSGVLVGKAIHDFAPMVLMNLAFGLSGNSIYAVAFRLASYTRMAVTGVTHGIDAVAARVSSHSTAKLHELTQRSTRLHAVVAFPCCLATAVLALPLLQLWIARSLEKPSETIPSASILVVILSIGVTSRSVGDGLMYILYGAGYVSRYAPTVLVAGISCPLLSAALLALPLPEDIRYTIPSVGYTVVSVVLYMLVFPKIGSMCLSVPYTFFFRPMVGPFCVTAACAATLLLPRVVFESWSIVKLVAVTAAFGLLYAPLTWLCVLRRNERKA